MIYSNKEVHDILSGLANIFLVIASILLAMHVIAPILGGKLLPSALIIYGSWLGFALCMKLDAKRLKAKEKINLKTYIPITAYGVLCMLLWFPNPFNIIAGILFIIFRFAGYIKERKVPITT